VGFSQPITSAEGIDSGDEFPNRLYKTGSAYPPAETAVLELEGKVTLQREPTANGSRVSLLGAETIPLNGLPDGRSAVVLADNEYDGYAAAEVVSAGNVRLRPAAGYGVDTAGAPFTAAAITAAGALGGASLDNFRFFPGSLVLTDANARARFNFPVPFPTSCWYVDARTTGDFGYSFNWTVVSFDALGATIRAGKNDNTLLPNTTLAVQLWAVGV
jgi:hypothetical protein